MVVYVVEYVDWEEGWIDSVWSTPQKAWARLKEVRKFHSREDMHIYTPENYTVNKYSVDKVRKEIKEAEEDEYKKWCTLYK